MFQPRSPRIRPIRALGVTVMMLAALALTALVPHQTLAQDPTETDANVRIVHASPDAPAVDVIVDGAVVASNLTFGQTTDALAISPNEHRIQVVPAGSGADSAVIDTEFDPEGGKTYIIAAAGFLNEIEAKIWDVDQGDLDSGTSRLRMIDLSPEDANVDLYVTGGDQLFGDLEFGEASDYTDLDAGTYDLEVRPHDQDTASLNLAGFQVEEGNAYDLLLIGQTGDQTLSVLTLTTPVAPPCTAVLGIGTPADACVRVIHASPDAPAVDIYVNGSLAVENLAYGAGTDFVALPAGDDREIRIVASGSPIDDSVFDTSVDLDAGKAYDVIAVGMVEDLDAIFEPVDLGAVPDGQARLRVIHAAPDVDDVSVVVTDGPTLFEGVGFEDTTDDEILDAGTYDIQVRQGDDVAIRVQDFTIEAGRSYDVIAVGRADDGTLQLIVFSAPTQSPTGQEVTPEVAATPMTAAEATPDLVASPAS